MQQLKPGRLGVDVHGAPIQPLESDPHRTALLLHTLGLPQIRRAPVCHGYRNGCVCPACTESADVKPHLTYVPTPRQPWEPLPLKRAA